jgi:hypothetical protein
MIRTLWRRNCGRSSLERPSFLITPELKNSVSFLRIDGSVLPGERASFFSRAVFEKLGLFSAYRWRCSFRGESEFFFTTLYQKNSVSSLFDGGSVLPGERPSFFSPLTRKTRSLLCLTVALFCQGRDRVFFHHAIPEKLGLFAAYRWCCSSRGETEFFFARRI